MPGRAPCFRAFHKAEIGSPARNRVPLEGLAGEGPASKLTRLLVGFSFFGALGQKPPQFRAHEPFPRGSLLQQASKGEGQNAKDGDHIPR